MYDIINPRIEDENRQGDGYMKTRVLLPILAMVFSVLLFSCLPTGSVATPHGSS